MRFRTFPCVAWLVLVAAVSSPASAQAPCDTWQTGFGASGPDAPFVDFVTFDDGSGSALYSCGAFSAVGGEPVQGVVRWTGARWVQVGSGLYDVESLGVFDDGTGAKLVAAGSFTLVGGAVADVAASWNGNQWVPLAGLGPTPNLGTLVNDLLAFDDGSGPALFLTGHARVVATNQDVTVARWQNGAWSDASSGIAANATPAPLALFDAGSGPQLYLGSSLPGPSLLRWNGSTWSDAAPGFTGASVHALATYSGGGVTALYIAGVLASAGPVPFDGVARFDGTSLTSLGTGLDWPAGYALAVHDFGSGARLVVGGGFEAAGGIRSRGLASWNGTAWEGLAAQLGNLSGESLALASFDDGTGPALFIGGGFSEIGGIVASWAARLQHGTWSRFARGNGIVADFPETFFPRVTALRPAVLNGERNLIAGGRMRSVGTSTVTGIARFDGSSWHAIGSLDRWYDVRAIAQVDLGSGPRLYAGGGSENAHGEFCVASWDGANWSLVGLLQGTAYALEAFDDGSGMALYAAGDLQGGDVQRWNGTSWQSLGGVPGNGSAVHSLCIHDDGSGPALYGSGQFQNGRGVARWTGSSWVLVGTGLGLAGGESRLISFDDGGGPELHIAAAVLGNRWLARWDGSSWIGIQTNGMVRALSVFHDGTAPRLCVTRTLYGSSGPQTRISKGVGDLWIDLGTLQGIGVSLARFDGDRDGVPELFLGGGFRAVEGIPSVNIARYAFCGTSGTIHCAGDGSATACPCGNSGAPGHGCANSVHASGAQLSNGGIASITSDTLRLDAGQMTGSFAILAQGTAVAGGTGVPFQDGLVCTGGVVTRLGSAPIAGGGTSFPQEGGPRLSQLGLVTQPGQSRVYQAIYRNQASFCTSGAANATNGLQVTWSL